MLNFNMGKMLSSRRRDAATPSRWPSEGLRGATLSFDAGENTIPDNEEFRLFLTTKMPNPHYSPEVQVKISLVNFTVTQSGLEEQLLGASRGVRKSP